VIGSPTGAPRRPSIRVLYDNGLVKPVLGDGRRPLIGPVDPCEKACERVADDLEIAMLTATFDARPGAEEALAATLARYVVLARHEPACRNVDLVSSLTHGGRLVIIEKWESAGAVQAHLDSPLMADMAREALPSLATKPALDLYETISAHDLE
jgi:quinol monooxygenase YgiN